MAQTRRRASLSPDARLRHEAERRGVMIADVIRAALERHLGAAASGHSGRGEVSERIEEILSSEMPASR